MASNNVIHSDACSFNPHFFERHGRLDDTYIRKPEGCIVKIDYTGKITCMKNERSVVPIKDAFILSLFSEDGALLKPIGCATCVDGQGNTVCLKNVSPLNVNNIFSTTVSSGSKPADYEFFNDQFISSLFTLPEGSTESDGFIDKPEGCDTIVNPLGKITCNKELKLIELTEIKDIFEA